MRKTKRKPSYSRIRIVHPGLFFSLILGILHILSGCASNPIPDDPRVIGMDPVKARLFVKSWKSHDKLAKAGLSKSGT